MSTSCGEDMVGEGLLNSLLVDIHSWCAIVGNRKLDELGLWLYPSGRQFLVLPSGDSETTSCPPSDAQKMALISPQFSFSRQSILLKACQAFKILFTAPLRTAFPDVSPSLLFSSGPTPALAVSFFRCGAQTECSI